MGHHIETAVLKAMPSEDLVPMAQRVCDKEHHISGPDMRNGIRARMILGARLVQAALAPRKERP